MGRDTSVWGADVIDGAHVVLPVLGGRHIDVVCGVGVLTTKSDFPPYEKHETGLPHPQSVGCYGDSVCRDTDASR